MSVYVELSDIVLLSSDDVDIANHSGALVPDESGVFISIPDSSGVSISLIVDDNYPNLDLVIDLILPDGNRQFLMSTTLSPNQVDDLSGALSKLRDLG